MPARRCWPRIAGSASTSSIFALELNRAECEFLTGELRSQRSVWRRCQNRATTTVERATVTCLHMDVCTTLDQSEPRDRGVSRLPPACRYRWSPHPTEEEVRREYDRIWSQLGSRTIEELIDLPLMSDPASLATVDVLTKLLPPAVFTDANLNALIVCRAVNLSLEHGNCDASCVAYVMAQQVAGPRFGDYQAGFRFGQLGYDLVEQRGLKRFEASDLSWLRGFACCPGRNMSGLAAICCAALSKRRTRSATSRTRPTLEQYESRTFSWRAIRWPRCSAKPRWPRVRREGAVRPCH